MTSLFLFLPAGNARFHNIIKKHYEAFRAAEKRVEKPIIIQAVLDEIAASGGRFLRPDVHKQGHFVELNKHQAKEKVSHALRDIAKNHEKNNPKQPGSVVHQAASLRQSPVPIIAIQAPKEELQQQRTVQMAHAPSPFTTPPTPIFAQPHHVEYPAGNDSYDMKIGETLGPFDETSSMANLADLNQSCSSLDVAPVGKVQQQKKKDMDALLATYGIKEEEEQEEEEELPCTIQMNQNEEGQNLQQAIQIDGDGSNLTLLAESLQTLTMEESINGSALNLNASAVTMDLNAASVANMDESAMLHESAMSLLSLGSR
jgi:hypothetical protein